MRIILGLAVLGLIALIACAPRPEVTGRAVFDANCAACHGADGKGGAVGGQTAPDLTRLSRRHAGKFPMIKVMSQIDGYHRKSGSAMPAFGDIFEGRTVLVQTDPGVMTPTPEVLVQLAAYLESLQEGVR